ncbi:MAG: hypothetical protein H7Z21_15075, partial [Hymenobacter sp.]|nr:hypothetical protein [Hymenobacter sp.]
FSALFRSRKDTSAFPLFPRGGTHWSGYGLKIAGDTLVRYIEHRLGYDMRDFQRRPGEVLTEPRGTDDDIAKTLNLIWAPPAYRMMYPTIEYAPLKPSQHRPNMLLIGDSFCWGFVDPFMSESFDRQRSRFWYYDSEVAWPENRPEGTSVAALDRRQQYLDRDVVLVMFTEYGLFRIDHFSDLAYRLFTPYTRADSVRIRQLEQGIARTPDLANRWWKKSAETGLSLPDLVHQAAVAHYDSIRP